jgi:hypothetical protein
MGSGVVDHDAVDLVRDIFEGVGDPFEMLEHLAIDGELHRARLRIFLESGLEAGCVDIVGDSFELDQPAGQLV